MTVAPEDWWLHCPQCGCWGRVIDHSVFRVRTRSKGKRTTSRGGSR